MNIRRNMIAFQQLFCLDAGCDDLNRRICIQLGQIGNRLLCLLIKRLTVQKIGIMCIVLIHRVIGNDNRNSELLRTHACKKADTELGLCMNHIEMQTADLFQRIEMQRCRCHIAIELLQLNAGKTQHRMVLVPLSSANTFARRNDIGFVSLPAKLTKKNICTVGYAVKIR